MRRFLIVFFLGASLAGCLRESPEELERLVKEDPDFKRMVAARDQSRQQARALKQDLLNHKKSLDLQIQRLRSEYEAYAKAQNAKITELGAGTASHRAQLEKEIETASAAVAQKSSELVGYQKTLDDVKKILSEGKGITLGEAERKKWEERILLLNEKIRPLAEEIRDLRLKIRLKKQKIQFLK